MREETAVGDVVGCGRENGVGFCQRAGVGANFSKDFGVGERDDVAEQVKVALHEGVFR